MSDQLEERTREKARSACLLAGVDHWEDDDGKPIDDGDWLCWSCLDKSRELARSEAEDRRLDDPRR